MWGRRIPDDIGMYKNKNNKQINRENNRTHVFQTISSYLYVYICERLITPNAYLESHGGSHSSSVIDETTPSVSLPGLLDTPLLQINNTPVKDASLGEVMYINRVYKRFSSIRTYKTPH